MVRLFKVPENISLVKGVQSLINETNLNLLLVPSEEFAANLRHVLAEYNAKQVVKLPEIITFNLLHNKPEFLADFSDANLLSATEVISRLELKSLVYAHLIKRKADKKNFELLSQKIINYFDSKFEDTTLNKELFKSISTIQTAITKAGKTTKAEALADLLTKLNKQNNTNKIAIVLPLVYVKSAFDIVQKLKTITDPQIFYQLDYQPHIYQLPITAESKPVIKPINQLLECDNPSDETEELALLIRQKLEEKTGKIAVVSANSNFKSALNMKLAAWDIKINERNSIKSDIACILFRLIATSAEHVDDNLSLLSLLTNPLCIYHNHPLLQELHIKLRREKINLREALNEDSELKSLIELLTKLHASQFKSLEKFLSLNLLIFSKILDPQYSAHNLNALINELMFYAHSYRITSLQDYMCFMDNHFASYNVPVPSNNVEFIGFDELLDVNADLLILPEFNEGAFKIPEVITGLDAEQNRGCFAQLIELIAARTCAISRALIAENIDTIASRWVHRFNLEKTTHYALIRECFFHPPSTFQAVLPEFNPPVNVRPKKVSVSGLEKLMKDPYSFYARYILRLKILENICRDEMRKDFGIVVHQVLSEVSSQGMSEEEYTNKFVQLAMQHFVDLPSIRQKIIMRKMREIAAFIYAFEAGFSRAKFYKEVEGQVNIDGITVTARADLIINDGVHTYIIDFKTGNTPSQKEVDQGISPQLPIEAIITKENGFLLPATAKVNCLYISLKSTKKLAMTEVAIDLDSAHLNLKKLLTHFLQSDNAFFFNKASLAEFNEYKHLARVV